MNLPKTAADHRDTGVTYKHASHMIEHVKYLHEPIGIMQAGCIIIDRVQYVDVTLRYVSN